MRAFYGSRISEHMTMTPEGYLICFDVPIARTGMQQYLRSELGITDDDPNGIVEVIRTEDEVFSDACIASFEGKPVTDDHPPVNVDTQNITAYNCGHAQHIRRGQGEESDLILADLFITDKQLIEEIKNGLREISCGYDCSYDQDDQGRIYQRCIRGNHVAVVPSGRAGHRVAIKDSQAEPKTMKGETNTMEKSKPTKNSLFAKLFSHAVKDMEPEQIADAVDEMAAQAAQATPDEAPTAPAAAPAKDEGTGNAEVLAAIKALGDQIIAALKPAAPAADEGAATPPVDEDPIQKLADELQAAVATPADQEASETVPADEMPEVQDDDGPQMPAAALPENPIPGADRAAAMAAINAIKPVLATLPKEQRKAASDAAAKEIRKLIGKDAKPASNGYAGINAAMQNAAKAKQKDAKPKADNGEMGKSIMASRNPHYKK